MKPEQSKARGVVPPSTYRTPRKRFAVSTMVLPSTTPLTRTDGWTRSDVCASSACEMMSANAPAAAVRRINVGIIHEKDDSGGYRSAAARIAAPEFLVLRAELHMSPSFTILAGTVSIVSSRGSSEPLSSFHCNGVETMAPGFARTQYAAATLFPFTFCR